MPPSFCCESWCNMNKKWCVYVHISPNKKYYVGITSQKPEKRWKGGSGYKNNIHFYNAIKKYGWDNFQHEIIASNITKQEAENFEILLIDKLKSNNKLYGYNITSGGEGSLGISRCGAENSMYNKHHTDESRKKMSDARKEYCQKLGYKNFRPIYQFSLDGTFLKEYCSVKDVCEEFGFSKSVIARSCSREINTAYGYIWVYKDMVDNIDDFVQEAIQRLKQGKLNRGKNGSKPIYLYDLNGLCLGEYDSASSLARHLGLSAGYIAASCSNKSIIQGKYLCEYIKE